MSYTIEEREQIQQAYETMLADIRQQVYDPQKLKAVDDAYHYSLEKYDGKYMVSGKAYML